MFFIYISIKLYLPDLLNKFYLLFDELVIVFNVFTFLQKYIIVKKYDKTSKKTFCKKRFWYMIEAKSILIKIKAKKYYLLKINYFFDVITFLK